MGAPIFFNSTYLEGPKGYELVESQRRLKAETNGVLYLSAILLGFCWVTLFLRFFARGRLMKNAVGWDDWSMLGAVICFSVYVAFVIEECVLVFEYLPQLAAGETPDLNFARKMNVAALLGYSVTMIALKISLCFFFIKIFASKRPFVMAMIMSTLMSSVVRLACVLVMTIKPCTLESFFFADIIECRGHPPSTPWSIMLDISTVANVLSDLLYCGLSAFAIASMTMRLRNKITSIVLCTLGTLGTIAAVIRAGIQLGHLHGESKFGATQLEVQWSVIELGFGITAASCATLRPLMDRVFRWINGKLGIVSSSVVPSVANPTVGSSRNGGVRGSSHRSAQLGSLVEELDVEDGEGEANKEKKSGGMVSFAAIAVDEVDGDGQPVYRTLSGP